MINEDLRQKVLDIRTKGHISAIIDDIAKVHVEINEMIDLFMDQHYRTAQYASWIVAKLVDHHKELIEPYLSAITNNLEIATSDTVRRNTMRILQFTDIPEELEGKLIDKCFEYIHEKIYPVAVKAFSVSVANKIIVKYPELQEEYVALLEEQLEFNSVAFSKRAIPAIKKFSGPIS